MAFNQIQEGEKETGHCNSRKTKSYKLDSGMCAQYELLCSVVLFAIFHLQNHCIFEENKKKKRCMVCGYKGVLLTMFQLSHNR